MLVLQYVSQLQMIISIKRNIYSYHDIYFFTTQTSANVKYVFKTFNVLKRKHFVIIQENKLMPITCLHASFTKLQKYYTYTLYTCMNSLYIRYAINYNYTLLYIVCVLSVQSFQLFQIYVKWILGLNDIVAQVGVCDATPAGST